MDTQWLDTLSDEEVEELDHRLRWVGEEARVEQLTPAGDWLVWLLLAGRGCVSASTKIYNPLTNTDTPVNQLANSGEPIHVLGLFREGAYPVKCDAPFLKGYARLWRYTLDDGSQVEVTDAHRFLTSFGWQQASHVHVGDHLGCGAHHPLTTEAHGPLECLSSEQRYSCKASGSQGDCQSGYCLCDALPQSVVDSDLASVPSLGDALVHNRFDYYKDDSGLSLECSHHHQQHDHPSRSSSCQGEPLLRDEEYQVVSSSLAHTPLRHRRLGLSREWICRESVAHVTYSHRVVSSLPATDERVLLQSSYCRVSEHPLKQDDGQWFDSSYCSDGQVPLAYDPVHTEPSSRQGSWLDYTKWRRAVSKEDIGVQPFYDLHVPFANNYLAEGIWHHNSGKTRAASEDAAAYGLDNPGSRIAVVAETFSDGRDVCVEGESGLLACLPSSAVKTWNRSLGEMVLHNGTIYKVFTGDKPDSLRGYQFNRAWIDELAKFPYAREVWTQLMLGLRLGENPQVVVTTTPRPIQLLRDLMQRENTHTTTGSTFDNAANLAAPFLEEMRARYEGTRIGRQELFAEILSDLPGALWDRTTLEQAQVMRLPDMKRVVVGVDPAMTSGEDADSTGIVVVGLGVDGNAYVLADRTCRMSPDGWGKRVVIAYDEFKADRVIAEVNNGGDLVETVLRTVAPRLSYKKVHASRGKRVRAEPVAALYEQQRVKHLRGLNDLENQMVNFLPEGMDGSPDRVDALVWALTELMLERRGRRKLQLIR